MRQWIAELQEINTAVDLGANDGEFSWLLAEKNIQTIATDFDHNPVNDLYKRIKKEALTLKKYAVQTSYFFIRKIILPESEIGCFFRTEKCFSKARRKFFSL